MTDSSENWPAVWRPREDWAYPTYDEGGSLPGVTVRRNNTGEPELVATGDQIERGLNWIRDRDA